MSKREKKNEKGREGEGETEREGKEMRKGGKERGRK